MGLVGYELVRLAVVGFAKKLIRRGAIQFLREHRVRLESARFIDRVWMRERLAWDPEIEAAILDAARETGEPIPSLRQRVDEYVEEIAPYFSISSYYQLGGNLAKVVINFCFELVVDHGGFDRQAKRVPPGAIRIYVINHRSNFDPVILAFGLLQHVSMSYAVGEWALVWPLSTLFRSFGSYFVRRGEEDPLYHKTLERFVQLLAGHGAVTGFFIEGGLSRDGVLRRPKTGLLDYLVKVRREYPDREVIFLPVGINYDRVLEDRYLVRERNGRRPKKILLLRLWNLVAIAFWLPILIAANVLKVATRSHKKFGYAAISFGEPLKITDWPGGATLHELSADERKDKVDALAEELLYRRIGAVVPVMPVPVLCLALLRSSNGENSDLVKMIREVIAEFRLLKAPMAFGEAFEGIFRRRQQNRAQTQMPRVDEDLIDVEEAELVLELAQFQLVRRRILRKRPDGLDVMDRPMVEYYANSVIHHLSPELLTDRPPEVQRTEPDVQAR